MSELLDWVMGGDLPKGTVHVYGETLQDVHYLVQPSVRQCQEDESVPVVPVKRIKSNSGGAAFVVDQLCYWISSKHVQAVFLGDIYGIRRRLWRETHGRTVLFARYDEDYPVNEDLTIPHSLGHADVVVVADYNKGELSPSGIELILEHYGSAFWDKLVIDHGNNSAWNDYREFQPSIVKINCNSPLIWPRTVSTAPVGIIWHDPADETCIIATDAIKPKCLNIFDPCGCGDVVLAVLAMARLFGEKVDETVAKVCMAAAAVEYGKLGATPVTREEIKAKYLEAYGG